MLESNNTKELIERKAIPLLHIQTLIEMKINTSRRKGPERLRKGANIRSLRQMATNS